MRKKIVIFDLDGTLLNTLIDLTNSTNFALQSFGYPQKTVEQVRDYVGNGVVKLIERAIPDGLANPDFENCLNLFKQDYKKNMYKNVRVYDGISGLLAALKNMDIKISVVSNKFDLAVKDLCNKLFPDLIDAAYGENEAEGIKKKPSPDMVLKVMNSFSLTKEECLYVGDSEVDIETAYNAGIDCVSVTWGFKSIEFLKEHGAKNIANTPSEIINYL